MGLFKSIKKAFKKIGKGIKKVVKKTVKGIKKIVKKIGSSKILKALAIAAAIVVTGGAALTAFGGTGALATSKLGAFMMKASSKMLGGSVFAGGGTLANIGNFAIKTVSKPFGAIGGALGSTARVGANLLTGQPALQAGPGQVYAHGSPLKVTKVPGGKNIVAGGQAASAPFSGAAMAGTAPFQEVAGEAGEKIIKESLKEKYPIATDIATGVGTSVLTGAAMQAIQGDPEYSVSPDGLKVESASNFDPLRIYAAERGISADNMYQHFTFGNTLETGMTPLFKQETIGVV